MDRKNEHRARAFFLKCTVIFTLIGLALGFNQLRYSNFTRSYISGDTPFSMAAQKVMPALSLFDEAEAVEHYHGQKYGDEWIVLKVTLHDDQYETFVESTKEKYAFYEETQIYDAVFCPCDNPILLDDYEFHVVDLSDDMNTTQQQYAAAIAMNDVNHSITYLFIDSFSFPFMGLDGVIRCIWPYIGVEM